MQQDIDELAKKLQQQIIDQARKQYSETVIDHGMNPRNPFPMDDPDGHTKIKGPCGDTMEFFIRVRDGRIVDASFLTDGCMTSIASGSIAVEMIIGRSVAEALAVSQNDILNKLGGLPKESRHCALLASDTLRKTVREYLATEREPWKKLYRPPTPT
ncbi:MAG: iron-sulfur cluster assembly scaffold protein [candidate division Zixibacteria bacterium]|nr:iron-sulfur cluster assembly scaffold protein [candidate division Zixibacteria bacterium]